jgi:transketolase C-terminal domain/subunit
MHHHLIIAEAHKRYGGMGTLLVNKVCQQYSTNFHISSLQTSDIQSYKSILMHNIIPKIFLRYLQSQLTNLAS